MRRKACRNRRCVTFKSQRVADQMRFWRDPVKRAGRLRQRLGLIVRGKRISCPPQCGPPYNDDDPSHHYHVHGFPLIRSLLASSQRSTSVLFSFVLSLLIVAGSFAIRQPKTTRARSAATISAFSFALETWHGRGVRQRVEKQSKNRPPPTPTGMKGGCSPQNNL